MHALPLRYSILAMHGAKEGTGLGPNTRAVMGLGEGAHSWKQFPFGSGFPFGFETIELGGLENPRNREGGKPGLEEQLLKSYWSDSRGGRSLTMVLHLKGFHDLIKKQKKKQKKNTKPP